MPKYPWDAAALIRMIPLPGSPDFSHLATRNVTLAQAIETVMKEIPPSARAGVRIFYGEAHESLDMIGIRSAYESSDFPKTE